MRRGVGLRRGRRKVGGRGFGRRRRGGRRRIGFKRKVAAVTENHFEIKELTAQQMTGVTSAKDWYFEGLGLPGEWNTIGRSLPVKGQTTVGTTSLQQQAYKWRAYVKASKILKFINRSATGAYITLYECTCRRDVPTGLIIFLTKTNLEH